MRRRGRERTRKRFCKKLPAEPFSGALPGVSVIELLVIESVFQYNTIQSVYSAISADASAAVSCFNTSAACFAPSALIVILRFTFAS